jgi:hypothetical protein
MSTKLLSPKTLGSEKLLCQCGCERKCSGINRRFFKRGLDAVPVIHREWRGFRLHELHNIADRSKDSWGAAIRPGGQIERQRGRIMTQFHDKDFLIGEEELFNR